MILNALFITLSLGFVADKELDKLQGTWQVTGWITHNEVPATADALKDFTFEFKGDTVTLKMGKKDPGREMTYRLDPAKKLKSFDLVDGGADGDVAEGIYKFDGDELTICLISGMRNDTPSPRPTEFKASKRDKYTLFVLKRAKK
jgi:uncharacterized protein (TIGR03067 family)